MSQAEKARRGSNRNRGPSSSRASSLDRSETPRVGKRPRMKEECMYCKIEIEKCKHLGCTMCEGYVCQPCSKISDELFEVVMKDEMPGFNWACTSCQRGMPSIKNMSRKLDTRLDALEGKIDGMEDRITSKLQAEIPEIIKREVEQVGINLEKQMEKKLKRMESNVNQEMEKRMKKFDVEIKAIKDGLEGNKETTMESMKEEIQREVALRTEDLNLVGATGQQGPPTTQVSPRTQMKMTVASVTKEMRDKADRRKNFIIYNLEEPKTNLKSERMKLDKATVMSVVQEVLEVKLEAGDLIEASRLGKEKLEGKRRPVLMMVRDERTKSNIFSNLAKLYNSDHKDLSFAHDLTKLEREALKKLITEAKMKDQEEGGRWKHRVRGPPWDMRITRKEVAQGNQTTPMEEEEKKEDP